MPVTAGKFCSSCGHSTCVKCTSEVHGLGVDTEDNETVVMHSHAATASTETVNRIQPRQLALKPMSPRTDSQSTPNHPLKKVASSLAVRNNPFILADQETKGIAAKPRLTQASIQARKHSRKSDCGPSQRASSAQRSLRTSGAYTARDLPKLGSHKATSELNLRRVDSLEPFPELDAEPPHCDSMNSLEKKIDKLYHHAEDLYNTRHIMEHLAAGTSTKHEHSEPTSRDGDPTRPYRSTSISPSATQQQPHSISMDPVVDIKTPERSHTIGKDPLNRVKGWSRPHTLSADSPAGRGPAPKARLSDTPLWLSQPGRKPGDAFSVLQAKNNRGSEVKRPASSPPMDSGPSTPRPSVSEQPLPHSEGKPQTLPWHHKPLRRVQKLDEIHHHTVEKEPSPEFRHHQLRKVTYPAPEGHLGTHSVTKNDKECGNCSPVGSTKHRADRDVESSTDVPRRDMLIANSSQALAEDEDLDSVLLPRPIRNQRPLTVAEVELALASESSLGKFSLSSENIHDEVAELAPELFSPVPIMPPNHHCSWKDQYLGLAAEVRHLKAEMASREVAPDQSPPQRDRETVDAGVGEDLVGEGLGIEGLTIVMHLRGRDDLVISTDLRDAL